MTKVKEKIDTKYSRKFESLDEYIWPEIDSLPDGSGPFISSCKDDFTIILGKPGFILDGRYPVIEALYYEDTGEDIFINGWYKVLYHIEDDDIALYNELCKMASDNSKDIEAIDNLCKSEGFSRYNK